MYCTHHASRGEYCVCDNELHELIPVASFNVFQRFKHILKKPLFVFAGAIHNEASKGEVHAIRNKKQ